jgi:hypothetical protein
MRQMDALDVQRGEHMRFLQNEERKAEVGQQVCGCEGPWRDQLLLIRL